VIPLGILAAAGGAVAAAGSYDLLATEILTSGQSSITFASLGDYAADYQHLQIRMTSRDTKSDTSANFLLRINGVTTSSYAHHRLYANGGSSLSSYASTSTSAIIAGVTASANAPSNEFGTTVIDVLDFASTSKTTTTRSLSGVLAGNTYVVLGSGLYNSTDAVASVTILGEHSNSFVTGSRFSLYGIRKAA